MRLKTNYFFSIMDKFDALKVVIDNFGLSREEIIEEWYRKKEISEDFLRCFLSKQSKPVLFSPKSIRPGMFYCARDGSFFDRVVSGKEVSGVVGYVKRDFAEGDSAWGFVSGLIVGLREAKRPWSRNYLFAQLPEELKGKDNTLLIQAAATLQNKKAEAAEWCLNYAFDGIEAGQAFLANTEEQFEVLSNIEKINSALERLGHERLHADEYYVTSSECDREHAEYVKISQNGRKHQLSVDACAKHIRCRVRPFIAFRRVCFSRQV